MIWDLSPVKDVRFISSPKCSDCLWGPPSLLSDSYHLYTWEGKQLGYEADHSPPQRAKVKNVCRYIATLPICLHGVYRGNLWQWVQKDLENCNFTLEHVNT